MNSRTARRGLPLVAAVCALITLAAASAALGDSRVTVSSGYVRQDGGSDTVISTCSSSDPSSGSTLRRQTSRPSQSTPATHTSSSRAPTIIAASRLSAMPEGIYTSSDDGST